MNRDKTKLLVKTMDPGGPSEGTVSRPPRYNPQQILEIPIVSEMKSNAMNRNCVLMILQAQFVLTFPSADYARIKKVHSLINQITFKRQKGINVIKP